MKTIGNFLCFLSEKFILFLTTNKQAIEKSLFKNKVVLIFIYYSLYTMLMLIVLSLLAKLFFLSQLSLKFLYLKKVYTAVAVLRKKVYPSQKKKKKNKLRKRLKCVIISILI